jgi:hypothetical protein
MAPKLEQTGIGCRAGSVAFDPEPIGCAPNQHRFADRLSSSH